MTPAEAATVAALRPKLSGMKLNERQFVTGLAGRGPDDALAEREAAYLGRIAVKYGVGGLGVGGEGLGESPQNPAPEPQPPGDGLPFHPLANLFPLIEGEQFDELVADIKAQGLREAIVLLDGQILDGRNRYRAGRVLGLFANDGALDEGGDLITVDGDLASFDASDLDIDDPLAFVISKNLHRRHLTPSQRAMVGAGIETFRHGDNQHSRGDASLHVLRAEAAEIVGTSERSIATAAEVRDRGAPELRDAVTRGDVAVSAAAEIARLAPEAQAAVLAEVARAPDTRRAFQGVVKDLRAEKQREKKGRREERERDLGARQRALPDKRYGVILADPEWKDENWSDETGMDRAPANHYPTSSAEVIAARPVGAIAAKDCALFLWTPIHFVRIAITVLEAWGFDYKTQIAWGKDRISTGRWVRSKHEVLILATRGAPPCPAQGDQWDSLQLTPKGEHSEKPDWQYELIEAYFPNLPKIELNARSRRPGWDAWGFEAPDQNEEGGDRTGPRFVKATVDGVTAIVDMEQGAIHAVRFNEPFPSETGYHSVLSMERLAVAGGFDQDIAAEAIRLAIDYATNRKRNDAAKGLAYPDRVYRAVVDVDGDLVGVDRGEPVELDDLPPEIDRDALTALLDRWEEERYQSGRRKKGDLPKPLHGNVLVVKLGALDAAGRHYLFPVADFPIVGAYLIAESYRLGERSWRFVADGAALDAPLPPFPLQGEGSVDP